MNKVKFVLFVAGVSLALGFALSCSSDDGKNSGLKECDVVFNPDKKFCYDGVVYDKCDGMAYNPTSHICQNGLATPAKCGNVGYNPLTQRCTNGAVEDKCGTNWYNKKTQGCCGNSVYSQATQVCLDYRVYNKCGNKGYDPLTQGCVGNEIVDTRCGANWYNQKTQGCCENSIYSQATQFCIDNSVYNKCGDKGYDPLTQYCGDGILKNYDFFTDNRDGKKYKVTVIGTQTWMAENLNFAAINSKCHPNNTANCDKYGRLYNWETAMNACLTGWHLPSKEEWQELVDLAGGDKIAGKKLKTAGGWNGNGNGTDNYGFSALPGGSVSSDGSINTAVGYSGHWWSASKDGSDITYYRYMYMYMYYSYESASYNYYNNNKSDLFSVRCLKD